jgi:hypothetical protein
MSLVSFSFLIVVTLYPSRLIYGVGISLMLSFMLLAYNLYRAVWLYGSISQQFIAKSKTENAT